MKQTINLQLKEGVERILSWHVGQENAISGKDLRESLRLEPRQERQMRLAIENLRHSGFPILFGDTGYYLPATEKELREGLHKWRSRIIAECRVLRDLKVNGLRYVAGNTQGKLL